MSGQVQGHIHSVTQTSCPPVIDKCIHHSLYFVNPPPKKKQEFPNTSYFQKFQTAFASYFAWFPSNTCSSNFYLLHRCIMRENISFYLHENVLDPKFINRVTSHQKHQWKEILELPKKKVITFSWPGKCIFIAEIKGTGIHCEISSPIWYIFYLLPDKKKLDKKGAISIQ